MQFGPLTHSQSCKVKFEKWNKESQVEFKTPWFTILQKDSYFTLQYSSSQIVILPIIENLQILLVKVKRPVIGTSTWELPAGGLEKGETEKDSALRELKEETGVLIDDKNRLKPMNTLVISPIRMPMFPSLFSINITKKEFDLRQSHDDEVEEVGLFSFDEIRQMILNEKVFVSLPLAILSRFLLSQIR